MVLAHFHDIICRLPDPPAPVSFPPRLFCESSSSQPASLCPDICHQSHVGSSKRSEQRSGPCWIHTAPIAPLRWAAVPRVKLMCPLLFQSYPGTEFWLLQCPILGSTGNLVNCERSLHLQVCEWQPPEQLRQLLDLEMRDTGESQDKLLKLCQDVIHFSVKTSKALSCP